MPHILRVRIQRATNLSVGGNKPVKAYVVIRLFQKKRSRTRVSKLTNNPTWNEVLDIPVDGVTRMDLVVKAEAGRKVLGTAFVDLTTLQPDNETSFICNLPNGVNSDLYFSVTPVNFDPSANREFGFIGMTYPLVFTNVKSFTWLRRSHFIWDEDLQTDVFRVRKSGYYASNRYIVLSDLSDTPLVHTAGKLGSYYYKMYLGQKSGPHLCGLKEYNVVGVKQTIRRPGMGPVEVFPNAGSRRNFRFQDKITGQEIATITRQPKKGYFIQIQPGNDVLFILMAILVADFELQHQEKEEKALIGLGIAGSVLITLVCFAPILLL